jgi:OPA family glycerol-3-phosphate transporter-like MFS transporter 1/2
LISFTVVLNKVKQITFMITGLIFGIWNSHTSVGNILGSLVAGSFVEEDWALSFFVPALIMAGVGFLLFLFLPTEPTEVGCAPPARPNSRVS